MKQFQRLLKITSTTSMAASTAQAHAVVQLKNDVKLNSKSYGAALQWTPGGEGYALELKNVIVDIPVPAKGHVGTYVLTANKYYISMPKGGDADYGLRFRTLTNSKVLVENTKLSANGGISFITQFRKAH